MLLLCLGLVACTPAEPTAEQQSQAPEQPAGTGEQPPTLGQPAGTAEQGVLYVEPFALFTGEAARLKPFLGDAGAVKLTYTGSKRMLECSLEVWENGRLTQTVGSMSSGMAQVADSNLYHFAGELIVTMDKPATDGQPAPYRVRYAFVNDQGYAMGEGQIPIKQDFSIRGEISQPAPLAITEEEKAIVWGMQASFGHSMRSYGTAEETLKQAEWALVAVVSLRD
jgi:hypothetical protein